MSAPSWPELEALFHEALARAPAERAAFLAERCASRLDLHVQVEALLRAHERTDSALEVPPTLQTQLKAGTPLGPYEVLSELGAGNMGEVYRARDARLGRDVAIKVLPALFLSDPERRARFDREARLLASLNHPHIAAIYGVEQAGATLALVLELVEGPTLADLVAHGPLQLEQALPLAQQIAEALEAAHEKGIVHRDLKPANIKITPAGVVKVLDFGIAKVSAADGSRSDLSQSPSITATTPREGVILGTAAYMSPEQARGHAVDKRADIWAFGCVLYEMLTGRQAFPGETLSDTIAAVLEREPDWRALPEKTPVTVRRLLHHCLEKDPKRRLRDIADLRIDLDIDETLSRASADTPTSLTSQSDLPRLAAIRRGPKAFRQNSRVAWAVAATSLLSIAALAMANLLYLRRPPVDTHVYRTSILPTAGVSFSTLDSPSARFALSPDGRRLAFISAEVGGGKRLWVQMLDDGSAQPLAGTEGASVPFWSPDSQFIGFIAEGKLKRIDAAGSPPLTLAAPGNSNGGGSWNRDGVMLFAVFGGGNPIRRVSASGGPTSPATTLDRDNGETRHAFPFFLPDGRHFLYLAVGNRTAGPNSPNGIYVTALDSKERKLLVPGGSSAMYAQGYLFFLREQTLMAQPFDVGRLELTGDPVPIAEHVTIGGQTGMAGGFTVSQTGVLAYQTGSAEAGGQAGELTQLVWFDRGGKQVGVLGEQARSGYVSLAADGSRAAFSLFDPVRRSRDIWLFDVARGLRTRLTFDPGDEVSAAWSPDGSRIVFNANPKGHLDLYQKASSGAGPEKELLTSGVDKYPLDWSPDGQFILFMTVDPKTAKTGFDLWILPLSVDRQPFPFLQTPFNESTGKFSPDGRWIAYASDESGRDEVYVAPFPGPGGKWQVSKDGGNTPSWRVDGKELFYLSRDNKLMAVAVNSRGSAFEVGALQPLFDARPGGPRGYNLGLYGVSPDGQRILMNTLVQEAAPATITLVVNWPALLNK